MEINFSSRNFSTERNFFTRMQEKTRDLARVFLHREEKIIVFLKSIRNTYLRSKIGLVFSNAFVQNSRSFARDILSDISHRNPTLKRALLSVVNKDSLEVFTRFLIFFLDPINFSLPTSYILYSSSCTGCSTWIATKFNECCDYLF